MVVLKTVGTPGDPQELSGGHHNFFFNKNLLSLFIHFEGEKAQVGKAETERVRENPKQAPCGAQRGAQTHTRQVHDLN